MRPVFEKPFKNDKCSDLSPDFLPSERRTTAPFRRKSFGNVFFSVICIGTLVD